MRISIVTPVFLPETNGLALSVYNRAIELAEKGHSIQLFIPDYGPKADTAIIQKLRNEKITVVSLPTVEFRLLQTVLMPSRDSNEIIDTGLLSFAPDCVIVDEPLALLLFSHINVLPNRLRKARILTLAVVHMNTARAMRKLNKPIRSILSSLVARYNYSKYDLTVFPSEYTRRASRSIDSGVVLKHLGVDKDAFSYVSRPPRQRKTVLYVGRISKEKNIQFLYKCAKRLTKVYPRARWQFVGDGPQYSEWKKRESSWIEFLGAKHRVELADCYKQADVYVSACDIESFGLTIVEAMATGLPVLVPDKGAAGSHFVDGVSGFTYKTGNQKDFIERILQLLRDDELRLRVGKEASSIPISWGEATDHLDNFIRANSGIAITEPTRRQDARDQKREVAGLDLRIKVSMDEHKQVLGEISEYMKLTIQLISIFLVFSGVAYGFGSGGYIWAFPMMQFIVLIFTAIHLKLDQDLMIDSAYVLGLEERTNRLLGQNILGWQKCVALIDTRTGRRRKSWSMYIGSFLSGAMYLTVFAFFGYLFARSMHNWWSGLSYLALSLALFLFLFFLALASKAAAIDDAVFSMEMLKRKSDSYID